MTTTAPTLRERIGGKWAVSIQTSIVSIPLILISVPLTMSVNGGDAETFWRAISIAILGIEGVIVWLFILHFTILRNRSTSPVPIALVAFLGLATGAIFGAINYFGAPLFGLEVPPRPMTKVLFMSIFT